VKHSFEACFSMFLPQSLRLVLPPLFYVGEYSSFDGHFCLDSLSSNFSLTNSDCEFDGLKHVHKLDLLQFMFS
jgi:hypothetical protein